MTAETKPPTKPDDSALPEVGQTYDVAFKTRPDLGIVRVCVVGADDPPKPTACGAPRVPILIISGHIPMANPDWLAGPGDAVSIPPFLATWTKVAGGAT